MTSHSQSDWQPDPQLLAAYFDGELTEQEDLRTRIEAWLEAHPEALADWAELKKLLADTRPAEPSESAWQKMRESIDADRPAPRRSRMPWIAAAIAASILLLIGAGFGIWRTPQAPAPVIVQNPKTIAPTVDFEDLPIASADEITILRIEGSDMGTVPVAYLPIQGELELADPGEVCISCKCPRIQVRQDPPHRPMVWARAD